MITKFIFYFCLTLIVSYIIIFFSKKLNLLDYPDERKLHSEPIPYTGGIILYILFIILISTNELNHYIEMIFLYSVVALAAGIYDDKFKIQPATKLIALTIGITILTYQEIYISKIAFIDKIYVSNLGKASILFTILFCLYIVNAFNYSDGIDGLTILLFVQFLIFINFLSDNILLTEIIFLIVFSVGIFLFNYGLFKLPKIFLGNGGANMMGYLSSFLIIILSKYYNRDILICIWSINYLINEFLATNLRRFLNNKPLFKSGRDHFHYVLEERFNSKSKAIVIITLINTISFLLGYFFYKQNSNLNLIILVLNFIIFYFIREKFFKTKNDQV